MSDSDERKRELQERLFQAIVEFPGRLDAMETRSEEASRALAFHLAELVEREFERRERGA